VSSLWNCRPPAGLSPDSIAIGDAGEEPGAALPVGRAEDSPGGEWAVWHQGRAIFALRSPDASGVRCGLARVRPAHTGCVARWVVLRRTRE